MTDREMIEQMENDICNACKPRVAKCKCNFPCIMCGIVATELVEKYQPKIPDGAVVLTKGAYESISSKAKANVVNAVEIRKETAEKILNEIGNTPILDKGKYLKDLNESQRELLSAIGINLNKKLKELAKQYGVEVDE